MTAVVKKQPPDRINVYWCSVCGWTTTSNLFVPNCTNPSCAARGSVKRVRYQLVARRGRT